MQIEWRWWTKFKKQMDELTYNRCNKGGQCCLSLPTEEKTLNLALPSSSGDLVCRQSLHNWKEEVEPQCCVSNRSADLKMHGKLTINQRCWGHLSSGFRGHLMSHRLTGPSSGSLVDSQEGGSSEFHCNRLKVSVVNPLLCNRRLFHIDINIFFSTSFVPAIFSWQVVNIIVLKGQTTESWPDVWLWCVLFPLCTGLCLPNCVFVFFHLSGAGSLW